MTHRISTGLQILWLFLAWAPGSSQAGQSWSVLTSMTYNSGYYIYDATVENYFINLGVRYHTAKWAVSASIPFQTRRDNVQTIADDLNSLNNVDDTGISSGLGDLYLFGERTLWKSYRKRSTVNVNGQIKIPLGTSETHFSSNVTDMGIGVSFRRYWGQYSIYGDAGFLVLGDPEGLEYADPFSYGLGLGRFFLNRLISTSLYYKAYTQIIQGIEPPRQASLSVITRLNNQTFLSLYVSGGLSESSPDYAVSLGLSRNL